MYANESRLFGYNATSRYVQTALDTDAPGGIGFTLVDAPTTLRSWPPPGNRLALDAHYKDLKAGGLVLFAQAGSSANPSDSFARLAAVTNVSAEQAVYGPLQGTVTWLALGLGVAQPPVVVLDSIGRSTHCRGGGGALWTISQIGAGGNWGTWRSLGGQIDLLAVGTNRDRLLEVFARGATDKALWHIWQTSPSGPWSGWSWLGGQIDLLAVGSNPDGRLEVLARGSANLALWHIWQTAPNNGWSSRDSLGGGIDLLSVNSNQDGRLEVFMRQHRVRALLAHLADRSQQRLESLVLARRATGSSFSVGSRIRMNSWKFSFEAPTSPSGTSGEHSTPNKGWGSQAFPGWANRSALRQLESGWAHRGIRARHRPGSMAHLAARAQQWLGQLGLPGRAD